MLSIESEHQRVMTNTARGGIAHLARRSATAASAATSAATNVAESAATSALARDAMTDDELDYYCEQLTSTGSYELENCRECDGTGIVWPDGEPIMCEVCLGRGDVMSYYNYEYGVDDSGGSF